MAKPWACVLHSIALAIIALLTTTSIVRVLRHRQSLTASKKQTQRYEDKDGVATEESQKAYSVKVQNILATLISVIGLGVSLAGAVRATLTGTNLISGWLHASLWVCYVCTIAIDLL
jgi:hypothetical protein